MTPVHGTVLIARPLWPVLGRVGDLLSRRGYSVETANSWSALLAEPGRRPGLAAVLLGEYGCVSEEETILRRFRAAGGPGVPVFLIGGQGAIRRTRRFREAGADMIFAAALPEEETLDRAQSLLVYGELSRNASSPAGALDLAMRDGLPVLPDGAFSRSNRPCPRRRAARAALPAS